MKNLDPKYLDERRLAKAETLEEEFVKPGSVIFLGTTASGFTMYGLGALLLISIDIFIKLFS